MEQVIYDRIYEVMQNIAFCEQVQAWDLAIDNQLLKITGMYDMYVEIADDPEILDSMHEMITNLIVYAIKVKHTQV